ncbi:LysR family transcriptional regulator [Azospirillum sp. ST 5-10]|uniref:LysR family transcriptional regulator n=1 Tax=unclassified Azospirillum TaxID=2630922 RepID=UPI003F4A3AD2
MIQDLRHIRAFLAVARVGNFTRAAAELNISQPALTVQIRQFEDMLGIRLFDRNKRQVVLTRAAKELLEPLQRVVVDLETVMHSASEFVGLKRGTVRIATLPSVAANLLPRAIQAFGRHHPGVVVNVSDVVAETIEDLVKSSDVDFGIGPRLRMDRDIEATDFLTDSMYVFFPDDHPLARRNAPTLRDIVEFPLILTSRNSSVRVLVERALEREKLEIHLACEANYMSTAVGMVRAGLGVSILPASAVDAAACTGITMKLIKSPGLTRKIQIIQKRGRTLSPAAEVFLRTLHEIAASPVPFFGRRTAAGRTPAQ